MSAQDALNQALKISAFLEQVAKARCVLESAARAEQEADGVAARIKALRQQEDVAKGDLADALKALEDTRDMIVQAQRRAADLEAQGKASADSILAEARDRYAASEARIAEREAAARVAQTSADAALIAAQAATNKAREDLAELLQWQARVRDQVEAAAAAVKG